MFTSPDFIHTMRKRATTTDFAVHVRGLTAQAVRLTVPLGMIEQALQTQTPLASAPPLEPEVPLPDVDGPVEPPEVSAPDDDPYQATKLT